MNAMGAHFKNLLETITLTVASDFVLWFTLNMVLYICVMTSLVTWCSVESIRQSKFIWCALAHTAFIPCERSHSGTDDYTPEHLQRYSQAWAVSDTWATTHPLTFIILAWYIILCLFTLLLEEEYYSRSESAPERVLFYFHFYGLCSQLAGSHG